MAVGVGEAERQVADSAVHGSLQRVVDGVGLVFKARNVAEALERASEVGVIAAGDAKIRLCLCSVWRSVGQRAGANGVAVILCNRLAGSERIVRSWNGKELVHVALLRKVCTFAADVRHGRDDVARKFLLDVEVPLLDVRPNHFVRDGADGKREENASADPTVTADVELRSIERKRRGAFERFGVGFVAVRVLEEDAVTTANGHFSVALWIPREADARSGVEDMAFHATGFVVGANGCPSKLIGNQTWDKGSATRAPALNDAVEGIASARNESAFLARDGTVVESRRRSGLERVWIEAESVAIALTVGSVEAQAQTEVKSELFGDAPVVLEVRLDDAIAVVILCLEVDL